MGKKGKFKEITNKWDEESAQHDADNDKDKAGAELVERAGNPINEDEVDGKSNKDRGSGELKTRKFLEVRDDSEGEHTDRNCETNRERVFDDVGGEAVFDAVGVFF